MKFRQLIIAIILLAFATAAFSQEFRTGVEIERDLLSKLEINGTFELRQSVSQFDPSYYVFQAGLGYDLCKYVELAIAARYDIASAKVEKELDNEFDSKTRYTADLSIKTKQFDNDFKIKNRLRYQHSAINHHDLKNFIRNKVEINYKMNKHFKPYLAIEPYWSFEKNAIRKVRLYLGNEIKIRKKEIELFIIIEGKFKDSSITSNHILGLSLSL